MGDNNKILLTKSYDNYKFVREYISKDDFCYHIAINRMYYSLFQYMTYIVIDLDYYKYIDTGRGSHDAIFQCFFDRFRDRLIQNDRVELKNNFNDLKNARKNADYKNDSLSVEEFESYVEMFGNVRNVIIKCHNTLKRS